MNPMLKKGLVLLIVLTQILTGCAAAAREPEDLFPPDSTTIPGYTPPPTPTPRVSAVTPGEETPAPSASPAAAEAPLPAAVENLLARNLTIWMQKNLHPGLAGRLLIPDAGIDVALYLWADLGYNEDEMRQLITDAEDSALLYSDGYGFIIADHSNQEFRTLSSVRKGDVAYIIAGDSILTLICDLRTNGINTGFGITDAYGDPVSLDEDFTCYTCGEDWTQIHIAGWQIVEEHTFSFNGNVERGYRYANEAYTTRMLEVAAERS